MALIVCADCGRQISDAAPRCIHCGRPREANLGYAAPAPDPYAAAATIAYPAQWDTPATARPQRYERRAQSFSDHWWRGKIYVVLSYLGGGLLILAGFAMLAAPNGGGLALLLCWGLAAGSFWLGDAVSKFRQSGYVVAMILQVIGLVGGAIEAFGASDVVGVQSVAVGLAINVIFTAYFWERREAFAN